jgi:hypothetical protein
MIKYLVELSNGKVDCIDTSKFFSAFPKSSTTFRDLKNLHTQGYVTLLLASDDIEEIGVNKKAIDYAQSL